MRNIIVPVLFSFLAVIFLLAGCSTPASVEITPETVILEGAGSTANLSAKILDADGQQISEGYETVWFTEDTKLIKLTPDGEISAVASGEAEVEVEVVGTEVKNTVSIRIKIPQSIELSHEKLRLWTGQVKDNVWAEVRSEKNAFIEGYLPKWTSDDPSTVKVEQIVDPNRRQSWVKITGMKSGMTYINATFNSITKTIRVSVFDEDEEVSLDGTRKSKDKEKEPEKKK
jgi:hypothetical protein